MPTYYRKLPEVVPQSRGTWCWAASLESWMKVTDNRPREWKQDDLRNVFKLQGHLTSTEALDDTKLSEFFEDSKTWMQWDYIDGTDLTLEYLGGDPKKGEREGKLRLGHVYLGIPAVGYGHVVVVYGVGYPDGKRAQISIMDPIPGVYKNVPLKDYAGQKKILIAWPKASVPPKW